MPADASPVRPDRWLWVGYLLLLGGTAYFVVRCLIDLFLVRRPALAPNLSLGGLAWLAATLFVCLVAVAARRPGDAPERPRKESALVAQVQQQGENFVSHHAAPNAADLDAALWFSRALALLCHLAVVAGLVFVGWRHFQDVQAGMAAATFYLLLPYTALDIGRWDYALPTALLVWAVTLYRRPTLAGLLLGLAAATVYFPVLAFPAWLSFYRKRGAGRFTAAFVLTGAVCLGTIGVLLWVSDDLAKAVKSALALSDWQPWRGPVGDSEGIWRGVHWAYRMPVFIAYLAFVAATAFWPAPKNLGHLLALTALVLLGVQFWYADRGGAYVLWYLPLLLLLAFRPNLSDCRPPPIQADTDWLARLGRRLVRLAVWALRPPQPLARAR